jgi:dihydroxyacetone kinase-like protein
MESIPAEDGRAIMLAVVSAIQDNAAYLSELDGATGDGDHGVNMNKGFTSFRSKLGDGPVTLSDGLSTLGETLMTEIGGAMGPLYGTLFLTMGTVCADHAVITREVFADMLDSALNEIQELGGASVGDKTLMDTLVPASDAYQRALTGNAGFAAALGEMAAAAEAGKESTRAMVAKLGRASRLGERSRGHLDAGATSCYLILNAMAAAMIAALNQPD